MYYIISKPSGRYRAKGSSWYFDGGLFESRPEHYLYCLVSVTFLSHTKKLPVWFFIMP
jgi:hypothetical protein